MPAPVVIAIDPHKPSWTIVVVDQHLQPLATIGHAMKDTAMVPRKSEGREPARPAPINEQLADELLGKAQAQGVELLGPEACCLR